jgi:hypothetical protein
VSSAACGASTRVAGWCPANTGSGTNTCWIADSGGLRARRPMKLHPHSSLHDTAGCLRVIARCANASSFAPDRELARRLREGVLERSSPRPARMFRRTCNTMTKHDMLQGNLLTFESRFYIILLKQNNRTRNMEQGGKLCQWCTAVSGPPVPMFTWSTLQIHYTATRAVS